MACVRSIAATSELMFDIMYPKTRADTSMEPTPKVRSLSLTGTTSP
jgi:hypothetical protein